MTDTLPRPVAITGVGLHCAFGGRKEAREALRAGRQALAPIALAGVHELPPCVGACASDEIPAGQWLAGSARKLLKYASPTAAMAIAAAGAALEDGGLKDDAERRAALGLYVAAGLIAFDVGEVRRGVEAVADEGSIDPRRVNEGLRRCHPLMPFKMLLNMPLGLVSIAFGLRGPNAILYPGPEQGAAAIDFALRAIAHGRLDAALVGGTAHALSLLPLGTLARLGCLASSVAEAQPFSANQRGLAPGDAAAFLLIEAEASAKERGARLRARLGGAVGRPALPSDEKSAGGPIDRLLDRIPQPGPPSRLLFSGATAASQRDQLRQACARRWRNAEPPSIESFDGRVGYSGAAALPLSVALALSDDDGDATSLLALATDPRGGLGATWLSMQSGGAA